MTDRIYSRIAGTGSYLPERIVTNDELSQRVDTSDEWIRERTGIRQRHIAADGQTTGDLAFIAAQRAMEAAGVTARDIELIVLGTTTPDIIFPSTACLLQHRLGANGCAAFDVNAACSGFIFALGVAMGQPDRQVVCIDGDGSVLMHLGALPIIGSLKPANLTHVLLNNAAHDSVGGQPTVGDRTDFRAIALAGGYSGYAAASTPEEVRSAWRDLAGITGPVLLEVRIAPGSRSDLGRPTSAPPENKKMFMEWLRR